MLDFEKELDKLLVLETDPLPQSGLEELASEEGQLLAALNKKQADISLQVEEIYDLMQEMDTSALKDALNTEKIRSSQLFQTVIGLCDIAEDFYAFARHSGNEELERQARMMWKNAGGLLEQCAIMRICETKQPFDSRIHTVRGAEASALPKEYVVRVLQSGYRYLGTVARKAAVILSNGMEETTNE